MISTNRQISPAELFDKADAAKLVLAMFECVDDQGDSLVAQGLEIVWDVAICAATTLHKAAPDQGEQWDGCVWWEYLDLTDSESLAYRLAKLVHDDKAAQVWVQREVCNWVEDTFNDVPHDAVMFNVEHEKLYFDADSICRLDSEEGWEFLYYHKLSAPTVEQVLAVLADKGWSPTFSDEAE